MLRRDENPPVQPQRLPAVGTSQTQAPNRQPNDDAMKHVLRVRPSFIRIPRMEMRTR